MLLRNTNISVINFTDTLLSTFLKSSINKRKTNDTRDLEVHALTIDRCNSVSLRIQLPVSSLQILARSFHLAMNILFV